MERTRPLSVASRRQNPRLSVNTAIVGAYCVQQMQLAAGAKQHETIYITCQR